MYRFWKNPYLLFFLALVFVTILLMGRSFPGRNSNAGAPPVLLELFSPTNRLASFLGNLLAEGRQKAEDWLALNRELEQLRAENENLRVRQLILEDLQQENIRLRQLLNFKDARIGFEDGFAAEVIGRNPSNWFESVTINRGRDSNVSVGMVAVNGQGLVGKVVSVSKNSAVVRLMTDPNSGVGVSVQRSREQGIVVGQLGSDQTLLVRFFSRDVDVRAGDEIVTSGLLSQQFPSGIPVGVVSEVKDAEYGLVKQAILKPWVDFDRLDELLLIPFDLSEDPSQ